MSNAREHHTTVINWNETREELQEEKTREQGKDECMYPDSYTQQKERRKKKIVRNQSERFDDYVREKRVRKPRNNKIKYYDYEEYNE